jgi:ADP-ribose pyrophosphatase YjhB (NUDIX family)
VTPKGKLVLVRLTYVRGWRLPGGGVGRGEAPRDAALRELGEEIGMIGHGAVICVDEDDPKRSTLFLVRDVRYAARRSLEIEEVCEFAPDALPAGTTPLTRRKIAEALPLLRRA